MEGGLHHKLEFRKLLSRAMRVNPRDVSAPEEY